MQTKRKANNIICTQDLVMNFLAVTQQAAIACHPWIGKNKKMMVDEAGTRALRNRLNPIDMSGVVGMGEG
ncbi:MAG: fructose-bisphosphatase class II [Bacillus sp. (in: Bacteria)]|nr:fructose-bisphosphatase class II [Bacillus sp. (in: firmicutes)]